MENNLPIKGIAKNPLGIIAIFISLIYGFSCIVLGSNINNLHYPYERLPLIWFIIVFPLTILATFIYLVIYHHEKLYSPRDYRTDDAFIKAIDKKKLEERILSEVKELQTAPTKSVELENEVKAEEQPRIEQNDSQSKEELILIHKNVENWVAKELSLKYSVMFQTNINVSVGSGQVQLDAFADTGENIYIVETKYWKSNKSLQQLKLSVQEFLLQNERLKRDLSLHKNFYMIIVYVFDILNNNTKMEVLEFSKNINPNCIVEFFEYEKLKEMYN